jgi:hypothetical protein
LCYDYSTDKVYNSLLEFAAEKLLCMDLVTATQKLLNKAQKYAVLFLHLALDINSTNHLTPDGPLHLVQSLHEQVANHMCICVVVRNSIETLYLWLIEVTRHHMTGS